MSRPAINGERILRALRSFESVSSEELLDVIGVPRGARSSYGHSLRRLCEKGLVARDGSAWPYRYRLARSLP